MKAAPVVVLDTNVVLSALVFGNGRLAALRTAWQTGQCIPLASIATVAELMRVLAFPKFRLTPDEQQELLADYLPHCRSVRIPTRLPQRLPRCRDPNDQRFIDLTATGKADFLVTGDQDLWVLAQAPAWAGKIITAQAWLGQFGA